MLIFSYRIPETKGKKSEAQTMELSQLRYFIRVADLGSVSAAAKELYVSQPTVSKQISLLEQELGVSLFVRNNRGVSLSEAGKKLSPDIRGALSLIDSAVQKAEEFKVSPAGGILRIGIRNMMDINQIIPGCLQSFARLYPDVQMQLMHMSSDALMEGVSTGKLDVIFTSSLEPADEAVFDRTVCSRTDTFLYYSRELQAGEGDDSLWNFRGMRLLTLAGRPSGGPNSREFLAEAGLTDLQAAVVPDLETLILELELGLGITVMGRSYHLDHSKLCSLNLTQTAGFPSTGTDAVHRRDSKNEALPLLLELIRTKVQ